MWKRHTRNPIEHNGSRKYALTSNLENKTVGTNTHWISFKPRDRRFRVESSHAEDDRTQRLWKLNSSNRDPMVARSTPAGPIRCNGTRVMLPHAKVYSRYHRGTHSPKEAAQTQQKNQCLLDANYSLHASRRTWHKQSFRPQRRRL